jgi:hypothetical protein|tara:strand:- start:2794 stop:3456 length:663 start_codon:yes stop_codon:yes gene_type:complete
MLINNVYQSVFDLANKDQTGGFLSASRYNRYAVFAQDDILNELQQLLDYNQRTISLLSDILKVANVEVSDDGYAKLPSDYFLFADANSLFYDGVKFQEYPCDFIGRSERGERLRSKIVTPELDYPIITEDFTGLLVEPKEVSRIKLTYIYQPVNPEWVGTDTVPPVFDEGASTDFALSNKFKNILTYKILKYFGIEIREPFLLSATTDNLINDFSGKQAN